ncbi:hypothetical protein KAR91_42030 [Candidatus Pacearchaeota archaeon]|nr:hypothetical protein [Candidatus Pacearchaeota archaeon]
MKWIERNIWRVSAVFLILFWGTVFMAASSSATVSITTSRVQYSCNGSTTVFAYPFKVYEDDDLEAISTDTSDVESTLILNTEYTVSSAGDDSGGNVTLATGGTCPNGNTLTLLRNIDITQDTDYSDGQTLTADGLESPPDKSRIIDQQFNENMDRSIRVIKSSTLTDLTIIPEADEALFFNSAGTGLETRSLGSSTIAVPASESIVADMINTAGTQATLTKLLSGNAAIWQKGADVASATALPLLSDGNSVDVTGTTTITSINSVGVGTWVMLQFDGALILTHHATNLILPGGVSITTAAGDHALMYEYASGLWRGAIFERGTGLPLSFIDEDDMASDSAINVPSQQSVKAYADAHGLIQEVNITDGAVNTGTTTIPSDDTIPQNTEGDEYLSLAITPTNANSKLVIEASINVQNSVSNATNIMALFQDTTASALAAVLATQVQTDGDQLYLRYEMVAGTTSATTFKIRSGGSSAGTTTFNGSGGARKLGGVIPSSLTITEIEP